MITDPDAIKKLALRSDLPRTQIEGFYLFAHLESGEQKQESPSRARALAVAFVELVAREERHAERPLPAILPRSFGERVLTPEWVEIVYACDLAVPFERRNRSGQVLAVTKHLRGRVRIFKGAFAYFAPEDLTPLETLECEGHTALE